MKGVAFTMLGNLKLNFGSVSQAEPLAFDPGHITVVVGPNNSGKSLMLREIMDYIVGDRRGDCLIINEIEPKKLSSEEVRSLLLSTRHLVVDNRQMSEGSVYVQHRGQNIPINIEAMIDRIQNDSDTRIALGLLTAAYTTYLDGSTRLAQTEPHGAGNLFTYQPNERNPLVRLFHDAHARKQLSELTFDAFGYYFTIDPTRVGNLYPRMSKKLPNTPRDEWAIDQQAVEFFSQAKPMNEFSDGVKAYVGIMMVVLSGDYRVIIVDEPEAFLHSPLARKLGRKLSEVASERAGHVFAATHSPDFLMGCIQSRKKVNVVRLTYREDVPSARLLSADNLQNIMRDPFLRSTGVLNALFHEGTVICEGDTDRAFYQEVNERMLEATEVTGVDSCLFLNANGKDTVGRIAKPLREMGIPAAVIVDLDIIKKGSFTLLLRAVFVPQALADSLRMLRDRIKEAFDTLGIDPKKSGVEVLNKKDKEVAESLLRSLGEYGLFVVPVGELEKWLPELQITGHGPYWLSQIFEKMGSEPNHPNYVRPQSRKDVWDFLERIAKWIYNPTRLGIPESLDTTAFTSE